MKYQSLDEEQLIRDWMLGGVERKLQSLFDQVRPLDGGFAIVRFLEGRPDTLSTIEDIAYFLKQPFATVEWGLNALVDLGVARCTRVVGLAFFGLTANPEQRQLVRELCDTLDLWQARLAKAGSVISGGPRYPFSARDFEADA
jgi:hypothetical protein